MFVNSRKYGSLFFLMVFCTTAVFSKLEFKDNNGGAGHADDISKLLTGKEYRNNSGNHKLFPILTGLTHIMYLTVDSTHRSDGEPMNNVNTAITYLQQYQKELKTGNIPNVKEFLTPGGAYHEVYTHLGWEHPYSLDTMRRWLIRKEILRDFLGKHFNFFLNGSTDIIKPSKRDSFAALLYYVHILGDHEDNTVTTARTRIPIKNLDEQNDKDNEIIIRWERNNNNGNGIPKTTIIEELNKHLKILFNGQENDTHYKNLFSLNGYLPEGQKEKAWWILNILFNNVPYLLKNEQFAKNFYNNILK
jgi:hypothetical protein